MAGTFLPGKPRGEETTEMGAGCWKNPLLLLAALALVLGRHQQWSGFQDSESPKNVNATLAFLLESYNNNSNDSYLFGVDRLLRSQVQVRQRHRCGAPGSGLLGAGPAGPFSP